MWFKNLKIYRISEQFTLNEELLQDQLSEFSFRPCGSQDLATMGWSAPLPQGDSLYHAADGKFLFSLKKQEKLLPAAVVNAELADKVAQIEAETGAPVNKKTQQDMKQEITHRLLPQAFTRNSFTFGFICPKEQLVVVDAAADGKAEAFLAMLRKALGSLPVIPLARRSIQADLTLWLKNDSHPSQIQLLEEAELKSPDEDGSIVRCKNQDLSANEISHHLDAGKLVQKLAVEWDESLSCLIQEDLAIKRLKFSDTLREQNDDIPKDQQAARLDADFALASGEILRLAEFLAETFELDEE